MLRLLSKNKSYLSIYAKRFCVKNNKISERLSFLNTEEEMRKYFNIIDWDKKEAEDIINGEVNEQKQKFNFQKRQYKDFDSEELYNIFAKYKGELISKKKDVSDPQLKELIEKRKNIELINEFSLPDVFIFVILGGFPG